MSLIQKSTRTSLPALAVIVAVCLAACTTTRPLPPVTPPTTATKPTTPTRPETQAQTLQRSTFAAMPGWDRDEVREAWPAFLTSCQTLIRRPEWKNACTTARQVNGNDEGAVRAFFESGFTPYKVFNPDGSDTGLVTGYYEPLLRGSRKRGGPYQTPLYKAPDDLLTIDLASLYPELKNMRLRGRVVGNKVVPYFSRAELLQSGALNGKELVWVDDPVEAFFLQVQGSGRVILDGSQETVRLAYADQNGYPYKSIGRYLVDKGEMTLSQASAQGIKAWVIANPSRQNELLNANPSYIFFKEEKVGDPSKGPNGAMGLPLTGQRSIAVDRQHIPLGAPVFLATTQPNSDAPLQRLVLAQDTGGAIRGAVRADYFWGFGNEAGEKAGAMKQRGMMWVLLPNP
ncbi:murein transglycosylase [Herbaspirillum sp. meg3]|uniref:murein transglycosylase A n=1 Tax=Herbaspirillum sp. meg3 TaxID=2025949 RepID=UPI000B98E911|nr:murein transglycosylase A [Herbaspirillum sp. meg3]ASU37618.1 murein transglycosylase [Herbaspirillum sp. meg3]